MRKSDHDAPRLGAEHDIDRQRDGLKRPKLLRFHLHYTIKRQGLTQSGHIYTVRGARCTCCGSWYALSRDRAPAMDSRKPALSTHLKRTMTGLTLFTGGGLADWGMQAAGVNMLAGVEYIPEIAAVAERNGVPVRCMDLLGADPAGFPRVDCLHASPPCPNFSAAKAGGEETANDIALAAKTAEFVKILGPKIFTLENVYGYRKSRSWDLISRSLLRQGYRLKIVKVNMASYGVPQTRERMIVVARLDCPPTLPAPTHAKHPEPAGLFGYQAERWVSWYEAIEDLLPTLPDSKFAPWQLKRLPDECKMILVDGNNGSFEGKQIYVDSTAPSRTINTTSTPRALLVDGTTKRLDPAYTQRDGERPSFTIKTVTNMPRALLLSRQDNQPPREGPAFTVTQHPAEETRAFIVGGTPGDHGEKVTLRSGEEWFFTAAGSHWKHAQRAYVSHRVVQMTPRALARFQSMPDTYWLPDSKKWACTVVGNAVPPLFVEKLYRHLLK